MIWSIIFSLVSILTSGCAATGLIRLSDQPAGMSAEVLAQYNQGAAYYQAQDFKNALGSYRAALDLAQTARDQAGIGLSLIGIGATQQALKEHKQAIESYEAALPYLHIAAQPLIFVAIGEVQSELKQDARAIQAFVIAEDLLKKHSEQDTVAILKHRERILFFIAEAYERLKNHNDAVNSYLAAAAISRKTGNVNLTTAALWGGGRVSVKRGDLQQAIMLFRETASLLEVNGKVTDAAWVRWELGQTLFAEGSFEESIKAFSLAAKEAEDHGLTDLAAGLYFGMGQSFEKLSQFDNALSSYRSALRQLRVGGSKNKAALEAATLHNIGIIHRWLSQYEEAIENLRMAARKYQEINNPPGEGETFNQLGEIFFWIAEPKTAVAYYKDALKVFREAGDLLKQVEVLAALGEAGYLTEEVSYEDGDKYFNEGQQLIEYLTGIDPYVRLKNLGRSKKPSAYDIERISHEWRERLPTLKADYRKAAGTLYQKWGRAVLDSDLLSAGGMLSHAYQYHSLLSPLRLVQSNREMAIELAKDAYFLGEVFRKGTAIKEALRYFRIAEEIANALRTPEIHFVYAGLARTYADEGDTDKALDYYKKGIGVLDSIRGQQGTEEIKIGVFAAALYEYRGFIRLMLDLYSRTNEDRYLHDSFEYNQKIKTRVFLEMLGRSSQTKRPYKDATTEAPDEKLRRSIAQIHHRLQGPKLESAEESKLLDQLEDFRDTFRSLQLKLDQEDPKRAHISSQTATVKDVQAALDPDSVLLEYTVSYDSSTLWAVTKEHIKAFKLPASDALQTAVESYLKSLRQPLISTDELTSHIELGQKLYGVLLEPVREIIRRKKHLIIAADGPLHYLPFETLITSDGDRHPTRANIEYLIKQFEVTYVPSASILVAQQRDHQNKRQTAELPLLAFGDPLYIGASPSDNSDIQAQHITRVALKQHSLSRLEFSAEEVLRIARILGVPSASQHINLRERATVEQLRKSDLSRYRILHFATHAIITDEVNVLTQPALVLSQGNSSAELLQFSDIIELKLNADLVVLSACDTGLGRLREGEGIVGLPRAFLYAGAASAVVSLWKVEDQSTSLLMEHFYKQLNDGVHKTQALRQAKLALMRSSAELKATGNQQSFAAPFYWAPFILIGDGRSVISK